VTNTPDVLTDTTADLAFALMLAAARRSSKGDTPRSARPLARLRTGSAARPGRARRDARHHRPRADRWCPRAPGARLRHADPLLETPPPPASAGGARYATLARLLADARLRLDPRPLTPRTRHLIGAAELARMKRTAILVNTSRGPLVDEPALIRALARRRIAAAGLDVFEREPHVPAALRVGFRTSVLDAGTSGAPRPRRAPRWRCSPCRNLVAGARGREPTVRVARSADEKPGVGASTAPRYSGDAVARLRRFRAA
jgi:hypothetical protein